MERTITEMDNLTWKQCTALRHTLLEAYQIISQGANVIMNLRHDIAMVQNVHTRRRKLQQRKPTGQQLITTWLHKDAQPPPDDMDIEKTQDLKDSDDDGTEWTQTAW